MVLSAESVYAYLGGMTHVDVRKEDLSPGYPASSSEGIMLVAAGCAEGRGSKSKLRFLRLLCEPEEAEKLAQAEAEKWAGQFRTSSKKLQLVAMDALQRMAGARKFIYREQLFRLEGGVNVRSGHWCFTHKGMSL